MSTDATPTAEIDRCIVCHLSIPASEGGLCEAHQYDDEVFCAVRFVRTESDEHREKCGEGA